MYPGHNSEEKMIRVLLVDDHVVLRDGLRYLLEANSGIEVVGSVSDGREAVSSALELCPDVIVMDISLPVMDGIEATRQIKSADRNAKIIILSMQDSGEHIYQALQAGAMGYLLKESAGKEVVMAVRKTAAGGRYFSRSITERLVQSYIQTSENNRAPALQENVPTLDCLSLREREVLRLVVDGKSSAEIGKILFLSPKTVETYRSRMMRKLGVSELAGLIRLALKLGILKNQTNEPEEPVQSFLP
jgi:DNA-binding NarL/FixJ family response regulator